MVLSDDKTMAGAYRGYPDDWYFLIWALGA